MTDIKVFINSEYKSQMYMGYDEGENRIVIAFRGSDNIRNWLSDLNFSTSTYPLCNKCAIHTGINNNHNITIKSISFLVNYRKFYFFLIKKPNICIFLKF